MESRSVRIIAEAGVNHNGDPGLAHELVEIAAKAGADLVKFQTFHASDVISASTPKAVYQKERTGANGSMLEMLGGLELPFDSFVELRDHCRRLGIGFLSTPFDLKSVEFLRRIGIDLWKIPSGEITNLPYLRQIAACDGHILLSTGMATLGDIEAALNALEIAGAPAPRISLLHCTTQYPAPFSEANLRAIATLRAAFPDVEGVGFSDHTPGIEASVAAVALGATVVEKHFTLDKNLPGPDHQASLDPTELAALVQSIRNIESAIGDGRKRPMPSEIPTAAVARKSLVALRAIRKGEMFTEENLAAKRPGTGVSPMKWDEYIGRAAGRDYAADELI